MPFRISGKNLEIGEALRERIAGRVSEALDRYFDGGSSGHVTVSKEAFGFRTECVVYLDSGVVLRSDSMAADAYLSADQSVEKLEKRLRRYHRKLKDYHTKGRGNGHAAPENVIETPDYETEDEGAEPAVIAESTAFPRRLSVSEAVSQLDMTGAPLLLFQNARHDRLNVVYRREDGNVGWIDPPAVPGEGR